MAEGGDGAPLDGQPRVCSLTEVVETSVSTSRSSLVGWVRQPVIAYGRTDGWSSLAPGRHWSWQCLAWRVRATMPGLLRASAGTVCSMPAARTGPRPGPPPPRGSRGAGSGWTTSAQREGVANGSGGSSGPQPCVNPLVGGNRVKPRDSARIAGGARPGKTGPKRATSRGRHAPTPETELTLCGRPSSLRDGAILHVRTSPGWLGQTSSRPGWPYSPRSRPTTTAGVAQWRRSLGLAGGPSPPAFF